MAPPKKKTGRPTNYLPKGYKPFRPDCSHVPHMEYPPVPTSVGDVCRCHSCGTWWVWTETGWSIRPPRRQT